MHAHKVSRSCDDSGDFGLRAALSQHPDARVTAIRLSGAFCAMPPELGSTHEVLGGHDVFELTPRSEWPSIIAAWRLVLQYGAHAGAMTMNDGTRVSVLAFDARDPFGVVVMLVLPSATDGDRSEDLDRPLLVSRFGVYQRDMLGAVVGLDDGARGLLGWNLSELAEHEARTLIHPDDLANAEENWLLTLVSAEPQRWRGRHLHADGTYRWIEFTNTNRVEDIGHVVSEMMDISEEMATAHALRHRDELLARLNDALPLGVIEVDAAHRVLYTNHRVPEIVGCTRQPTLVAQLDALAPGDREALDHALARTLAEGCSVDLEVRFEIPPPNRHGRVCAVSVRALRDDGAVTGAVLCIADITESVTMRRQLEYQATFDQLTGCYNRAATLAAVERVLHDEGGSADLAVLFIDLDGFKPVNDELGHAAGDELLAVVAHRLRAHVRRDDVVGRIGGDEFLVVCRRADRDHVSELSSRLAVSIAEPVPVGATTATVTASIGVAWAAGLKTADAVVAAGDAAMYEAKRSRRRRAPRRRPGDTI